MPQLPQLDSHKMYMLFVLAIVVVAIAVPLLNFLSKLRASLSLRRAQSIAVQQRKQQNQKQVFVRQTDIESNMSREDRQRFDEAEAFVKAGNILEAARIFESIRFQRKAIDLLEHNGHIEEACNILLRLKVPMRAAVLYERNNMLDKAAYYYQAANKIDKAAECYLALCKTNFRYLGHAAEACGKAGDIRSQIKVDMMGMQTVSIAQRCLQHRFYDILIDFLRDPIVARDVLANMDEDCRKDLLDNIPLVPQNIQMLVGWIWILPDYNLCAIILAIIAKEIELTQYFWMIVPLKLREFLIQLVNTQAQFMSLKILTTHAQALHLAGLTFEAQAVASMVASKTPAQASLAETEPPRAVPFPLSVGNKAG
jgi:tetratricopeptide (TPR) repeat protein